LEEAEDGAGYADGEADDVVRFGAVGERGGRKGGTEGGRKKVSALAE